MHILFITGEYAPMPGGVGAYTRELARALVQQGVQVSVATSLAAGDQHEDDGISVYPVVERWGWRGVGKLRTLARDIGASWLHVQYQTAAFAMHPAINFAPGSWQNFHTAWTYHDLLVPYLFPKAGDRLRRWVTLRPANTANLVITTNSGDHQQLARQVHASRITHHATIPIGSNIRRCDLSPAERRARRQQRGYGDNDFVLAYFGFLNRSKGGETLVRTLHALLPELPNTRLLMIGERVGASDPTNFAYLREIEALVDDLDLADRVQWTGHQADADVAADLNAVDALLMPYVDGASLRRGTLMAGLANGCAIVTTEPQAPLPELVDGRDLLYVPPGDVAATVSAVKQIAGNPAFAQLLRKNAQARSELFTWESIAREHLKLYQNLETEGLKNWEIGFGKFSKAFPRK